jgi:hypothetical protein
MCNFKNIRDAADVAIATMHSGIQVCVICFCSLFSFFLFDITPQTCNMVITHLPAQVYCLIIYRANGCKTCNHRCVEAIVKEELSATVIVKFVQWITRWRTTLEIGDS